MDRENLRLIAGTGAKLKRSDIASAADACVCPGDQVMTVRFTGQGGSASAITTIESIYEINKSIGCDMRRDFKSTLAKFKTLPVHPGGL